MVKDQIRIAVQLVDPATQTNLWSDEYQSTFADVFKVQADISMNVANALAVEFSAAERADIERGEHGIGDPERADVALVGTRA